MQSVRSPVMLEIVNGRKRKIVHVNCIRRKIQLQRQSITKSPAYHPRKSYLIRLNQILAQNTAAPEVLRRPQHQRRRPQYLNEYIVDSDYSPSSEGSDVL